MNLSMKQIVETMRGEAEALDQVVRAHPPLRPFFAGDFAGRTLPEVRNAYLRLLKMKADYVIHSVPMLHAAGEALRGGDDEDRAWSELFLGYARDEIDAEEERGHHVWARADLRALGAPRSLIDAPAHPIVSVYSNYLVTEAGRHPYAILGTKCVLEHLSIRMSDDLVQGVLARGVPGAEQAVTFFHHHGQLDLEHVRAGDRNLERIQSPAKRLQILEGAFFTSGCYRAFLRYCV
jgi:hypothetical protein